MKYRLLAITGSLALFTACGSGPTSVTTTTSGSSDSTVAVEDSVPPTSEQATTTSATQIANPASVFCIEQGGTLEIVDEADGQVGYCTLPDGTRVEEWEYYRSQNPDAAVIESELPGDGVD